MMVYPGARSRLEMVSSRSRSNDTSFFDVSFKPTNSHAHEEITLEAVDLCDLQSVKSCH
jgi:hypothetical protein